MEYFKIAKSIPDIVSMLQSRGLIISDTERATDYLKKVSYFRFAAYLRPLASFRFGLLCCIFHGFIGFFKEMLTFAV